MKLRNTVVAGVFAVASLVLQAQPPSPITPEIAQRVDALVSKMSLDDKLTLIGGIDNFYTQPIDSIGLKRLKMSDASVGVRTFGQDTAYTASVALAASWDPALAERIGSALGDDARARGVHFLLGPGVNIYRSPLNGRNMEYLGEDPYLAGRMATSFIHGVQNKGVAATVKHYAANNSEYDRHRINSIIDERTLREIYLPAFEMAVKDGQVAAVMDSYNLVNGEHATQNGHLNNEILKKEWGFKGVLMSDWDATYDGVAAANGGLDLEMPYAKLMTRETLKAALAKGSLKMATLDDKVRRILLIAARFGWLDRDQWDTSIPLNNMQNDLVALDEARESITLLKNDKKLLPLDASKMKSIAIIGPEAAEVVAGGGGSSNTTPFFADSYVAGFAKYLGEPVKVYYTPSAPDVQQLVSRTHFQKMTVELRKGSETGKVVSTQNVRAISTSARDGGVSFDNPGKGQSYYTWKGEYTSDISSPYLVMVSAPDADGYRVLINGEEVIQHAAGNHYRSGHQRLDYGKAHLQKGVPAKVEVIYNTENASPRIGVAILPEDEMVPVESRRIIQNADAVLVAVGFDKSSEGEGFDRTYTMPGPQNELIQQVAALNPKTVVAITAGGAVETAPWIDKVSAVLTNYYPGQEGARALAEVLFGARSPEGHLPFSWERVLADNPASAHYAEEPGDGRAVHYAEGLFLGYRYYTSMNKQPLFAFGHGLSYTSFAYSHLNVKRNSDDDVEVSFDVENKGSRPGATVAQVYVGEDAPKVKRPTMELKQFQKVRLKVGEKQHVVLHLNRRAFQYYDVSKKDWTLDSGRFTISLGEASDQILAKASVTM